jgi:hypothetical protein
MNVLIEQSVARNVCEQDARTAKGLSDASPLSKRHADTAAHKMCTLPYLNTEAIYI